MNSGLEHQGPIGSLLLALLIILAICLLFILIATCYLYDICSIYRRMHFLRRSPHGIVYDDYKQVRTSENQSSTKSKFLRNTYHSPNRKTKTDLKLPDVKKFSSELPIVGTSDDDQRPRIRTPRPNSTLILGLGRLTFSLKYNEDSQILHVHLICGKQLCLKNGDLARMPFVKVYINNKIENERSSSPDDTPNPEFDEVLSIPLSGDMVGEAVLNLTIWDTDSNMFKIIIGYIRVPLGNFVDSLLGPAGTGPITREINENLPNDIPVRSNGEILFSLSYTSENDKLVVAILKCRGVITKHDVIELYVIVSLCIDGKIVESKQTSSIDKFNDQVFNQIVTFEPCIKQPNVTEDNISLHVVLNSKTLTDKEIVVGKAVVGRKSNEEGISHWQEMVNSSRTAVAQWHRLVF